MPLSIPAPPDQVAAAAQDGMRRVVRRRNNLELGGAFAEDRLNLRVPHKVYTLGLTDLVAGMGLNDAKFVGWRYLAGSTGVPGASPVGVAEVLDEAQTSKFSSYNRGWLGAATERAVAKAESLPQVATEKFELRMFRVPAAKIDTLWLKSDQQDTDLIVPIASANRTISVEAVYGEADFIALARQVAMRELQDDQQINTAGNAQ
jgi:hypothetical protein